MISVMCFMLLQQTVLLKSGNKVDYYYYYYYYYHHNRRAGYMLHTCERLAQIQQLHHSLTTCGIRQIITMIWSLNQTYRRIPIHLGMCEFTLVNVKPNIALLPKTGNGYAISRMADETKSVVLFVLHWSSFMERHHIMAV